MNSPNKSFISAAAALALSSAVYGVTVTTNVDEFDNNCTDTANMSLRDAVFCTGDGGVIDFSVPLPNAITMSSSIDINKSLNIVGPGINELNLSVLSSNTLFTFSLGDNNISDLRISNSAPYGNFIVVPSGSSLLLSDVNITNNDSAYLINNSGNTTILRSSISDNTYSVIQNSGALVVKESAFVNNTGSGSTGSGLVYSTGGTVTIGGTIIDGNSGSNGGAIKNVSPSTVTILDSNMSGNVSSFEGGAIHNTGNMDINNSRFIGNISSSNGGGAIYHSTGTLTISESIFQTNYTNLGYGGAIYQSTGNTTIETSSLKENNASIYGGGVYVTSGSSMDIIESTISGNSAPTGGGVKVSTFSGAIDVNILNSTISSNLASASGGGIYVYDYNGETNVTISHSSITNNSAISSAGGLGQTGMAMVNTVKVKNTILSSNTAPSGPNCNATYSFNSYGYNLIDDNNSCPGFSASSNDIIGVPSLLFSLADNGGPTFTHALDTLSPARGVGSNTDIAGNTVLTDQRGKLRATPPSIGAYEPQPAEISVSPTSYDFGTYYVGDTSAEYNITVSNIGEDPMTIDSISLFSGTSQAVSDFDWTSYCVGSIPSGSSCTVGISYYASDILPDVDNLVIADTIAGISAQVTLSGTGTTAPIAGISLDPTALYFGYVEANVTATQSVTITNSGSADLTVSSIGLLNNTAAFTLADSCSAPIAPGGSCAVDVTFSPTGDMYYVDSLVITSDAGTPITYVPVTGNGYVYYTGGYDEIYFGGKIAEADYTAATAIDPTVLADETMFEVRFDYKDGLERQMIDVIPGSTNHQLNFYDFNATTFQYDILKEENTFTTIGNVMNISGKFEVKYVGTLDAYDLNSSLFGTQGKAYQFVYKQLVDDYRLYETEHNSTNDSYSSLAAYLQDHNASSNNTFMHSNNSTYLVGLVFDYTSGATTGNLLEVDLLNETSTTAGTWKIEDVTGIGDDGKVLRIYPTDTDSYRAEEIWAMKNGAVTRGELEAAGSTFRFYWFDQVAHNDFVRYFDGILASTTVNGIITLPSSFTDNVTVTVFAETDGHDHVEKSYTLTPGTPVQFSLEVPDGTENFKVGYYVQDATGGIVQQGYFTGTGTSAYRDEAALFSTSLIPTAVALDLLSGKTISGTVTLPAAVSEQTYMDITASVDILGASALFRHYISADIELQAGQSSADYTLTLPAGDTSTKYYLAYDFFEAKEYIRQGYYSASGTTPYYTDATAVDVSAGNKTGVDITILDGVSISGTASIESASNLPTYLFVRAIRDDGYEVFGGADVPADASSVTYAFDVPATTASHTYRIGYYLFKEDGPVLSNNVIGYWNSTGTVTNLAEAESFAVTGTAVSGKDMTISATAGQTITVQAGWNLLSLPSKAEFTYLDMILHFGFNEEGLVNLAKYTPAGWSYFMVKGHYASLNRFNSLRSNEGFWLQSLYGFDLGLAIADDADYADEVAPLNKGWNLVGINSDKTAAQLVELYRAKGYTSIESVWVYRSGTWYLYIPDVTLDAQVNATIPRIETTLSKNEGIWILLKGE